MKMIAALVPSLAGLIFAVPATAQEFTPLAPRTGSELEYVDHDAEGAFYLVRQNRTGDTVRFWLWSLSREPSGGRMSFDQAALLIEGDCATRAVRNLRLEAYLGEQRVHARELDRPAITPQPESGGGKALDQACDARPAPGPERRFASLADALAYDETLWPDAN